MLFSLGFELPHILFLNVRSAWLEKKKKSSGILRLTPETQRYFCPRCEKLHVKTITCSFSSVSSSKCCNREVCAMCFLQVYRQVSLLQKCIYLSPKDTFLNINGL